MNNYDNYSSNNDSSKGWALGFGLLAGIAIGYYLNSNEGRAARRKAAVRFDEYGNQITEYSKNTYNDVTQRANTLVSDAKVKLEEGKQWATEAATNARNTVSQKANALKDSANDTVSSVEASFKRGVDNAKTKVKSTSNGTTTNL